PLGIWSLAPVGITPIENGTLPAATSVGTWMVIIQTPTRSGDNCTAVTGTPPAAIPAITVYCGATVTPGAGTELVGVGGLVGPSPVAKAISNSPLRAGFWMLT